MSGELKESVGTYDALLFMEEEMSPIFCKPKLLPMKTLTMEKLEQMQRDAEKLVRQTINPEPEAAASEEKESQESSEEPQQKQADVWSADD